jgi:Uma2 family endonuclease
MANEQRRKEAAPVLAPAKRHNETFTYREYAKWPEGTRCELIDGKTYMMSSASQAHQDAFRGLYGQLYVFLKGKECRLLSAPFGVRLNAAAKDDTVVQPDILVVCDKSKLKDGQSCVGAPDFIAEILSPSTRGFDQVTKFNAYLEAGVREYWIVDPEIKSVSVFLLKDGEYVMKPHGPTEDVPVSVLPDCTIRLPDVFGEA